MSHNLLNSIYNSNMENIIKNIELNQILNLEKNKNNLDNLSQFDELKFDNTSEPIPINETKGINKHLQRDIEFKNEYTLFQDEDMHYNVVNNDRLYHSNMIPNTSQRDLLYDTDLNNNRRLELFTGNQIEYNPKKEISSFFKPSGDLTWVNGMPSITNTIKNRFLPSNKNNYGNLPFDTNLRVKPGVDSLNQQSNYAVYRIKPYDIDKLRSKANKKVTFLNKPLETIKLGELRADDTFITKY
jgi:hypothetical protein